MTLHARGSFIVRLEPQAHEAADGVALGRMSIDKQFSGDLEASSKGEMLSVRVEGGSAVYVAIERVSGALGGRSGGFVLVHQGRATAAGQELTITIAPDSGIGELAGIAGSMGIEIVEGEHRYTLDYTLAEAL